MVLEFFTLVTALTVLIFHTANSVINVFDAIVHLVAATAGMVKDWLTATTVSTAAG
jgi:hypothetical protein